MNPVLQRVLFSKLNDLLSPCSDGHVVSAAYHAHENDYEFDSTTISVSKKVLVSWTMSDSLLLHRSSHLFFSHLVTLSSQLSQVSQLSLSLSLTMTMTMITCSVSSLYAQLTSHEGQDARVSARFPGWRIARIMSKNCLGVSCGINEDQH